MDAKKAQAVFTALAQPTRLKAFRRLIAAHPDGLTAGAVALACKVPHNTMSTHLAALTRAGLVGVERAGRNMNYHADIGGLHTLIAFLTDDCCNGRPEICAPLLGDLAAACCPPAVKESVNG